MVYWGFGLFWAAGTERNSGPTGSKTEKRNFLALGGSKSRKRNLSRYPGWLSAKNLRFTFCPTGHPGAANREILVFKALLPFGTWRNHRRRPKTENHNFLALEVPKSRKQNYHAIRDDCPQLSYLCVLTDWTPEGGKSQNTGVLGPFGLGQPLALREIPGRKQKNTISRSQGHFWGGNPSAPKFSPKNCAIFLHFVFSPIGPLGAANCKILVF